MLRRVVMASVLLLTGCASWYRQPDPLGGGNTRLTMAPPLTLAQDASNTTAPAVTPAPCVDPTPPNAEGVDPDDDDNCK